MTTPKEYYYFILEYLKKDRQRFNDIQSIAQHFNLNFEECIHLCRNLENEDLIVLKDRGNELTAYITVFGKEVLRDSNKLDEIFDEVTLINENDSINEDKDKPKAQYQEIGLGISFIILIITLFNTC